MRDLETRLNNSPGETSIVDLRPTYDTHLHTQQSTTTPAACTALNIEHSGLPL
jgi:hypothetical protein